MSQRENSPVIAADFLTGFAAAALPAAERLAASRHYRRLPHPRYAAFWDGRAAATAAPLGRWLGGAADPAALAAGRAWFESALAAKVGDVVRLNHDELGEVHGIVDSVEPAP